jgi:hypothetical protein
MPEPVTLPYMGIVAGSSLYSWSNFIFDKVFGFVPILYGRWNIQTVVQKAGPFVNRYVIVKANSF